MAGRASPTVIVSRRVRRDQEEAFSMWVTRLITAAYRTPGYVSAGLERPNAAHPDEWLVVYRFESAPALENWLTSDARRDLLAEGEGLYEGEPREQIVAGVADKGEVRVVSSYRLRDGVDAEHILFHQRMLDMLQGFEGFKQRDVLDAVPGVQPETVVTLTFDNHENLKKWIDSSERAGLLEQLKPLTEGALTTSIVGGFAGWFPTSDHGSRTPKWKQAVVVFVALYPTVIFTSYLAKWLWPDLNLFLAVFVGNVISIAILTWILMPPLTMRLAAWLQR